jgi:filamentous hemagglutinin family protein
MKIGCWSNWLVFMGCAGILLSDSPAIAQLNLTPDTAPDRALGTTITPVNAQIDLIRGGIRPQNGPNLFHSFQEFNVSTGKGVYFANPGGVRNILTRVTGTNPSSILGTLGVLGTANLFLISPNGIVFGPNASLDLRGGSFYATTASGVKFGDLGEFSATNSQPPGSLLTINPSAFLFTTQTPGNITNQSRATQTVLGNSTDGLRVRNGQNLLLLGGTVTVDGGRLTARGGQIEIGAVAGAGVIGLSPNGTLNIPTGVQRADVTFTNDAFVDTIFSDGGSIDVTARNINILNRSVLSAGIFFYLGTSTSQSGDITLNATDTVNVDGFSAIQNAVFSGASGNGGNIQIDTGSLFITNFGIIQALTEGRGNAGSVRIRAQNRVLLAGGNQAGTQRSAVLSRVFQDGQGNGGDIDITARSLEVIDRAALDASTFGRGNPGSVLIRTSETVLFDDSVAFSAVGGSIGENNQAGFGNGGNIEVTTGKLTLLNGGQLDASTFSQGNSGNIIINARTVLLDGTSSDSRRPSALFTEVVAGAEGNGGAIQITTESLSVTNGGKLEASTRSKGNAGSIFIIANSVLFDGRGVANASGAFTPVKPGAVGNGGNIQIETNSLTVSNRAQTGAGTEGEGDGGTITLNARDFILFADQGVALSAVAPGAEGNGGNLVINAGSLTVRSGGQLSNTTAGIGNAGDVIINAREAVSFDGTDPNNNDFASAAASNVQKNGIGNGGDVRITARSLSVSNEAILTTDTQGQGNAGNIIINTTDQVIIDNGVILSRVGSNGTGDGGDISITTGTLALVNGATLTASTFNEGDAGDIRLRAGDRIIFEDGNIFVLSESFGTAGNINLSAPKIYLSQGLISAESATVDGGNITLDVQDLLLLRNGSLISTTAGTAQSGGNGGNITINAPNGFLIAVPQENSDITANAFQGSGGNIRITARGIFGTQFRPRLTPESDVTASSTFGLSGTVAIASPDTSALQNALTQLPKNPIDTTALLSNSCIVRRTQQSGSFTITGSGGLPVRPDDASVSAYPTGKVQSVDEDAGTRRHGDTETPDSIQNTEYRIQNSQPRPWKIGDPIVEPTGVYQLKTGQLVMSRECEN